MNLDAKLNASLDEVMKRGRKQTAKQPKKSLGKKGGQAKTQAPKSGKKVNKAQPKQRAKPIKDKKVPQFIAIKNPPATLERLLRKKGVLGSPVSNRPNSSRRGRSDRGSNDRTPTRNRGQQRNFKGPHAMPMMPQGFINPGYQQVHMRDYNPGELQDMRLMEEIKIHANLERIPTPLPQQKNARVPFPHDNAGKYYGQGQQGFDNRHTGMGDVF
ncbi:MAG: hypothetical protein KVP17_000494 [Porospora cf. gigantea B]|uniref:uncharacterized protein n=1 Tax=Porospora cf. gigantea B TaxID=2853592 RepID=UPI003571968D|nr:MAG: hypothetical protein KVP17_000494 [Porospora cf. gigantea B]